MRCRLGVVASLVLCIVQAHSAEAGPLAFTCEEQDAGKPAPMTLTYDGDATGTLKVVASFGTIALPATKEVTEVEVEGQKVKQTGIRAFGQARITMPEQAALEACIASKRQPGDTDDILGLMACLSEVARAPSDAKVSVEVVTGGAVGGPMVFLSRAYVDPSSDYRSGTGETGGTIAIEAMPPPICKLSAPS